MTEPQNHPKFTLVICTFNPRRDYLTKTLQALQAQTLDATRWELLLVDNASKPAVSEWIDLSWHPQARCVVEQSPGIAQTRIRGAEECRTEWLVFVDDDNLLDSEYLERCLPRIEQMPSLGAFGGFSSGAFESLPSRIVKPYLHMLAIMKPQGDQISTTAPMNAIPWTAGMCIRREIMLKFAERHKVEFQGLTLGDDGTSLLRGEDNEIVFTAWDLGYMTARFDNLHFTHLIPSQRLTPDYFIRLATGMAISSALISLVRNEGKIPLHRNPLLRLAKTAQILFFIWPIFKKRMILADQKGRYLARSLFLTRKVHAKQ